MSLRRSLARSSGRENLFMPSLGLGEYHNVAPGTAWPRSVDSISGRASRSPSRAASRRASGMTIAAGPSGKCHPGPLTVPNGTSWADSPGPPVLRVSGTSELRRNGQRGAQARGLTYDRRAWLKTLARRSRAGRGPPSAVLRDRVVERTHRCRAGRVRLSRTPIARSVAGSGWSPMLPPAP